jgi:hypothetical protein
LTFCTHGRYAFDERFTVRNTNRSGDNAVATPTKTGQGPKTAQEIVESLIAAGLQPEEIAFRVRVCLNSVVRWRAGGGAHRGHVESLRALAEQVAKEPPRTHAIPVARKAPRAGRAKSARSRSNASKPARKPRPRLPAVVAA